VKYKGKRISQDVVFIVFSSLKQSLRYSRSAYKIGSTIYTKLISCIWIAKISIDFH